MLEDARWVLESYNEPGKLKVVIADTEITAEFVSDEEIKIKPDKVLHLRLKRW